MLSEYFIQNESFTNVAEPVVGANVDERCEFTQGRFESRRHGYHAAELFSLSVMAAFPSKL
jgi:hypothetical protein